MKNNSLKGAGSQRLRWPVSQHRNKLIGADLSIFIQRNAKMLELVQAEICLTEVESE